MNISISFSSAVKAFFLLGLLSFSFNAGACTKEYDGLYRCIKLDTGYFLQRCGYDPHFYDDVNPERKWRRDGKMGGAYAWITNDSWPSANTISRRECLQAIEILIKQAPEANIRQ